MTITIAAEPVPLEMDENDTIRVKGSRVTLDTIVELFKLGQTVEELADDFDTLALADIYAIISYYLHHQAEVEKYLAEQEAKGEVNRQKWEAHSPI